VISKLEQAKKLKHVTLSDCGRLDSLADFLVLSGSIQVVSVSNCPKLRSKDLETLSQLPLNEQQLSAGTIRKLTFTLCGLESIPVGLFKNHGQSL
jgi:hypothetical protein